MLHPLTLRRTRPMQPTPRQRRMRRSWAASLPANTCRPMTRAFLTPGPQRLAPLITFRTLLAHRQQAISTSAATARRAGRWLEMSSMRRRSTTSTAHANSFFGAFAGQANTTGSANSFFGRAAGVSNTNGGSNSFFGTDAGRLNTGGSFNSFFGEQAGANNFTGQNNSYFGISAGFR